MMGKEGVGNLELDSNRMSFGFSGLFDYNSQLCGAFLNCMLVVDDALHFALVLQRTVGDGEDGFAGFGLEFSQESFGHVARHFLVIDEPGNLDGTVGGGVDDLCEEHGPAVPLHLLVHDLALETRSLL